MAKKENKWLSWEMCEKVRKENGWLSKELVGAKQRDGWLGRETGG